MKNDKEVWCEDTDGNTAPTQAVPNGAQASAGDAMMMSRGMARVKMSPADSVTKQCTKIGRSWMLRLMVSQTLVQMKPLARPARCGS
jgi:hypothetical protein